MNVPSIFSSLFGSREKPAEPEVIDTLYPEEVFSVSEAYFNEKPVIGSFNMAYKDYRRKADYPWCLRLSVALEKEAFYENGLPMTTEFQLPSKLEEEIFSQISEMTTLHYIGHFFNDDFLDSYAYLENPDEARDFLSTQIPEEVLEHGLRFEIHNDPDWNEIRMFMK